MVATGLSIMAGHKSNLRETQKKVKTPVPGAVLLWKEKNEAERTQVR